MDWNWNGPVLENIGAVMEAEWDSDGWTGTRMGLC